MSNYASLAGRNSATVVTPQSKKIPGSNQEKNNAGGYSHVVTDWAVFDRFLILGTSSGQYYSNAKDNTEYACDVLESLIAKDAKRVVDRIVEVSDKGLAIKNGPAVFALAVTVKNTSEFNRKYALDALSKVCRTSTDLFAFVSAYKVMKGGFGSSVKKALSRWYQEKSVDSLAYQMVKYRQRDGWTHHDVLHLAHPKATSDAQNVCFKFAKFSANKDYILEGDLPAIIEGYLKASIAENDKQIVSLIKEYKLPREAIPTQFLNNQKVWETMLPDMPATAMIRNLGTMSSNGLLGSLSETEKLVIDKLGNRDWLKKSRVHPISILIASKVYGNGRGILGSNSWNVNRRIVDALQDAFYSAFDNIEPTDEAYLLGVDISGSMTRAQIAGIPGLTAAEAAIALAMTINKQNERSLIMGFSHKFIDLNITHKDKFDVAMRRIYNIGFGGTDCSLPMIYAEKNKLNVDKFVVITDNETWAGAKAPCQALRDYRASSGKNSGLAVCATSVSKFTIADPKDPKQIDIVGFSPDVPRVISSL